MSVHPDSADLVFVLLNTSWLCFCILSLCVHPDSADLCVRKYPPFGHAHEQHRKGSIVLVVVEEDVSEPVPVPIAKIAANYILQSTFFWTNPTASQN